MSFWSRFEEFFIRWFCGPRGDTNTFREYAHSIGASEREKPGFSRNNVVDWLSAFTRVRELYRSENHFLNIRFFDAEQRPRGYRYLFYDFDSKDDIERARREVAEFVASLSKRFGIAPVVVFSGSKGYHVYVVLDREIDFGTYSRLWNALLAPFSFSTVDRRVLDPVRLSRVPYTYNVKPGRRAMAYLVDSRTFARARMEDFDWSNYEPLRLGDVRHLLTEVRGFEVPRPRRLFVGRRRLEPLPPSPEDLDRCSAVPPCIRNIVETLKTSGNPDHAQRLVLVWYLKWVGYSKEQVLELFRKYATDFDERVSRYQIEYAYGERGSRVDWLAPSCRWMKERGLCLECGWDRNVVTYTYARAYVPEEVKQRFFELVRRRAVQSST